MKHTLPCGPKFCEFSGRFHRLSQYQQIERRTGAFGDFREFRVFRGMSIYGERNPVTRPKFPKNLLDF